MRKSISLFLAFSMLLLAGNLFAKERKGIDLIISKADGQYERGELIAVKESSLLLMEKGSGRDVTVDIGDIKVIQIEKKSKFLKGAGYGLLIGGGGGALSPISASFD